MIVMIWMTLAPITDLFIAGLLVWFLVRPFPFDYNNMICLLADKRSDL